MNGPVGPTVRPLYSIMRVHLSKPVSILSAGSSNRAVFLHGSTMRHVLVMSGASAAGAGDGLAFDATLDLDKEPTLEID